MLCKVINYEDICAMLSKDDHVDLVKQVQADLPQGVI